MNFVNTCGLNENPTEIITVSPDLEENLQQLPEIPEWGMDYRSDSADGNQSNNYPISTRDLISWSFQIARGMDFLVSKQVLHGDLAARNVLLAYDGVVKVADFGLARQFYVDYDYIKQQQVWLFY
jgi:serine/threonine protein kinase